MNITNYTMEHIPEKYQMTVSELRKLLDSNEGPVGLAYDAFVLGFEKAYKAAKAGKLGL